jgi:hypothetical protein
MPPLADEWVDLSQAACFWGLNVIRWSEFEADLR